MLSPLSLMISLLDASSAVIYIYILLDDIFKQKSFMNDILYMLESLTRWGTQDIVISVPEALCGVGSS